MDGQSLAERLVRRDRVIVALMIGVLFLLAALYTISGIGMDMSALDMTAMRGMADMPGSRSPGVWTAGHALLVFLMWWVMMVAMMLPSVAPTVLLYAALLRRGSAAARVPAISAAFVAGYLAAWAGFSAGAAGLQWGLEALGFASATMLRLIDSLPGALVLVAAGLFQFTKMKSACLTRCRSPAEFIARRKRPGIAGGFAMGVEHGFYCVGCCWVLMALLFVGGVMNLIWIAVLAAWVAVEKLTPFGDMARRAAGIALIVWGGIILAGAGG